MFLAVCRGRKCCTGRGRRFGRVGDTLTCRRDYGSGTVELRLPITTQIRTTQEKIARHLWKQEGFESEADYIQKVTELHNRIHRRWHHPEKPLDANQKRWVHWFHHKPMPKSLWRKLVVKGVTEVQTTKQLSFGGGAF